MTFPFRRGSGNFKSNRSITYMHQRLTVSACLLITCCFCSQAFAGDYIIELLIFENLNRGGIEEQWRDDFQNDTNTTAAMTNVSWQAASSYKLGNARDSLARSSDYRPLLHTAWRQSVSKRGRPVALPDNGTATDTFVSGSVTVTRGRYLHLDLDLVLNTAPDSNYIGEDYRFGSVSSSIRLQQKRRMRSKELHYIDHPRFGVLALITPVGS